MQPLFRWRMARAERGQGLWSGLARFAAEHKRQVAAALAEIRMNGVMAAADLADAGASKSAWWGWSDGKKAFEYLFWSGQLAVAGRRGNFERLYDLPERGLAGFDPGRTHAG